MTWLVYARLSDFPNRRNSLNALRLLLAVAVIVSHAWPIGGFGDEPRVGTLTLGQFAVAGFFAISGWLITQSRLSSELPSYAWRRFLRIYPGFLVALLAVAFVFAPLGSALGAGPYSVGDGIQHMAANITMFMLDYSVGGTPQTVPYAGTWNGSLWTLFHEALCYAIVGLVVTLLGRRFFAPVMVIAWVVLTVLRLAEAGGVFYLGNTVHNFLILAPYFFAGATLFVLRSRLPLHWALAGGAAAWLAVVLGRGEEAVLAALPLAYLCLWLGARLPLHGVGRRNDISYGMYVYAFPVQQLLVLLGVNAWGTAAYVLACVAVTVPFAVLSWVGVERPAQRFRRAADQFPWLRSGARLVRRKEAETLAP